MGIIYNNAELLLHAKADKVSFKDVLTIGRLSLFLSAKQLKKLSVKFQVDYQPETFVKNSYAEHFIKVFLGADTVSSLDYSKYEQCTVVHDMNCPVDKKWHEKYDIVIDGGTLEHVFNFPVALANCMNMVKKGGSLFVFSMANNHMGHGFYQFSPELFYRAFQKQNGYKVDTMILEEHPFSWAELGGSHKLYGVVDPADVEQRVGLANKKPVMIMVHAKRTEIKAVFESYPIQSDYFSASSAIENGVSANGNKILKNIRRFFKSAYLKFPLKMQEAIYDWRNFYRGYVAHQKFSFSNKIFFKRIR
jgi:hypothetical protein